MTTVSATAAALAYRRGATFLDTRSDAERSSAPLPGAVAVASAALAAGGPLPAGTGGGPYYVVCASGLTSEIDALYLRSSGLEAFSVLGGVRALLAALASVQDL